MDSLLLDAGQLWSRALDRVRPEVGNDQFNLWLEPLRAASLDGSRLRLQVPNRFFASGVRKHFHERLTAALSAEADGPVELDYEVSGDVQASLAPMEPPAPVSRCVAPAAGESDSRYTLASFVVADCNRLAYSTAEAIARTPGTRFNPCFIHGGVGLGKTHLLQAIRGALLAEHPRARVLYTTGETFVNEFIQALRQGRGDELRRKYRSLDCLLIDDIQFLIGKDRSQEEFFHTFNDLFAAKKQVVLSSDLSPKDMVATEERIISRFQWGVVAELGTPDAATRAEIIRRKAAECDLELPADVVQFLAGAITTNVRLLEGYLITLSAAVAAGNPELTIDRVKKVLGDSLPSLDEAPVRLETILQVVAQKYAVDARELKGQKRSAGIVVPRQVAMYLSREMTGRTLQDIGAAFGRRDHSTVKHAHEKIQRQIASDPFFVVVANKLRADILAADKR